MDPVPPRGRLGHDSSISLGALRRARTADRLGGADSEAEAERPTVTFMYGPLPFIKEVSPELPLPPDIRITLHWVRFLWITMFAIIYYHTVDQIALDNELTSGEVQGILGELFPDQALSFERITKGEVSPTFGELMNGDDVSKLLNWIQAYCMYKAGSDEHVPFAWGCALAQISIGKTHPAHWDFIHDSPFTAHSSKTMEEANQVTNPSELTRRFCSRDFIERHIINGDVIEEVPFGDVEAFRKKVRMEIARDEGIVVNNDFMFASTYDEWAVLNGNPLLNAVRRSAEMSLRQELPKFFGPGAEKKMPSSDLQRSYETLKRMDRKKQNRSSPGESAMVQQNKEPLQREPGVSSTKQAVFEGRNDNRAFLSDYLQQLKAVSRAAVQETLSEVLQEDASGRRDVVRGSQVKEDDMDEADEGMVQEQAEERLQGEENREEEDNGDGNEEGVDDDPETEEQREHAKDITTGGLGHFLPSSFLQMGDEHAEPQERKSGLVGVPTGPAQTGGAKQGSVHSEPASKGKAKKPSSEPVQDSKKGSKRISSRSESSVRGAKNVPNANAKGEVTHSQQQGSRHRKRENTPSLSPEERRDKKKDSQATEDEDGARKIQEAMRKLQANNEVYNTKDEDGEGAGKKSGTGNHKEHAPTKDDQGAAQNIEQDGEKLDNHTVDGAPKRAAAAVAAETKDKKRKAIQEVQDDEAEIVPDDGGLTNAGLAGVPAWCAKRDSEVFTFLEAMNRLGVVGVGGAVSREEMAYVLRSAYGFEMNEAAVIWKLMDPNNKGSASFKDIFEYVLHNRGLFENCKLPATKSICRNHHWGMLHMCGPESIKIVFRIEQSHSLISAKDTPESGHKRTRDSVTILHLSFKQVGLNPDNPEDGPTGWYSSGIELGNFTFIGRKRWPEAILLLCALVLFMFLFLFPFLFTVLSLPHTLYMLFAWSYRQKVTSLRQVQMIVNRFWDGQGVRSRTIASMQGLLELVFSAIFIVACVRSMNECFFQRRVPSQFFEGVWPSRECQEMYERDIIVRLATSKNAVNGLTRWEFITGGCLDENAQMIPELLFVTFFQQRLFHGVALLFLCFRLFDLLNAFEGTCWLNQTLDVAFRKLSYFGIFYSFNVCSFAILVNLGFGSQFQQFRTFQRAGYVLILYSFGFTDEAFSGVHPFEEATSFQLTIVMSVYSVLIVTISMQFFLTIIIDTYTAVIDPDRLGPLLRQEHVAVAKFLAWLLYPNVTEAMEDKLSDEDPAILKITAPDAYRAAYPYLVKSKPMSNYIDDVVRALTCRRLRRKSRN